MDLPKIKDSLGNFVTPNRRVFNTIIKYTAKRHQFSEEDNTDMIIMMIKRISRMNEYHYHLGKEMLLLCSKYVLNTINVLKYLFSLVLSND